MSRFRLCFALLASALALACNVVLDNQPGVLVDGGTRRDGGASSIGATSDAGTIDGDEENDGCGPGSKLCDGVCVSTNDPHFGCAAAACARCAPAHGVAACSAGACVVTTCDPGFADCNRDPNDGCEADLASVLACGGCAVTCPSAPHAVPSCDGGACALVCEPGFGDCNAQPDDGCEKDLRRDKKHCGACGSVCIFGGRCRDGVCTWDWD
jgi:hypothetical protein